MPNTRTSVPMDVLAEWLTSELRKFDGCDECEVTAVYRLREPDKEGCNWSMDGPPVRATGVPPEILRPALADVVARAKERFNVSP